MSDSSLSGRCHCGECNYTVSEPGKFHFCCQCESCRGLCAGGRLLGISVPAAAFSASGSLSQYTYPGGSGEPIILEFCSKCSTQLFARPTKHPEVVIVRANTLNEPKSFKPRKFLFSEQGYDWDLSALHE